MESNTLNLIVAVVLGAGLGVGGTMLVTRIRNWLGYSETGRLRGENRVLSRRLAEKDRHVRRMLSEAQRLAEQLGQHNVPKKMIYHQEEPEHQEPQ